jgi:(2Fe-2S) ferredoxin
MSETTREKNLYECHVFVCTNKRDNGKECCADKGAVVLRDQLKAWAKEKYGKRVRVNNSGCLDFCAKGIVSVIYPEGEWLMNLTSQSLDELKTAISEKMD